jgi:predicted nucleic acid-binding Zn ribbon protein
VKSRVISDVGGALSGALDRYGLTRALRERAIFLRWEEIVGTAIANHSEPKRYRNGTLWVHVADAAWRQELSGMRSDLARRINAAIGEDLVTDIVLR